VAAARIASTTAAGAAAVVVVVVVVVAVAEALALEVADCCPRAAAGHARGTRKVSATSPTPRPEPVRPSSSRIAHLI
jgi:hypothetical protein